MDEISLKERQKFYYRQLVYQLSTCKDELGENISLFAIMRKNKREMQQYL